MHLLHRNVLLLAAILPVLGGMPLRAENLEPPVSRDSVTIRFPKGWVVNAKTGGHTLMTALAPQRDKDGSGEFQASFSVAAEAGATIDGAAQQARVAKEFPDYKSVEPPAPITVNGLQGVTFGGTFTSGKLNLRSRQYIFPLENQLCVITFTGLQSRWADYRPLVEASVATFTVRK
jgi:hypothetical protein